MKQFSALLLVFTFATSAYSQNLDYMIFRKSLTKLSCIPADSFSVVQACSELQSIDTILYDKNLNLYYSDLGWSYYRLFLHTQDTTHVKCAIGYYLLSDYHKPSVSSTYWQLASLYHLTKDCLNGRRYLEKYKGVTKKTYRQKEQMKLMRKKCDN
jgi:hypothetical protein